MNIKSFWGVVAVLVMASTSLNAQTPVRSAMVEFQPMQLRHAVTGSIRAVSRGDVAALEAGRVTKILPRAGHSVKEGDILARIDARRLEAQKREAHANLEVARAELVSREAIAQRAQADLRRAENLVKQNAVSKQEYDLAQANDRVANAEIESAKRQIERLQESIALIDVRLSDTLIKAPYNATVIERHVEPGDWVQPGETLLTLVSSGPVEAWLEVPERYIESLEKYGHEVVVRARATGSASRVLSTRRVSDVNRRVRTIRFVATLENEDELLTPGMSVDAWIAVSGMAEHLSVPKDAVIRNGGSSFVFRVANDSSAEKIPVQVLFETTDKIAIATAKLKAGEQVIVEGNERLVAGQQVAVTETKSAPAGLAKK